MKSQYKNYNNKNKTKWITTYKIKTSMKESKYNPLNISNKSAGFVSNSKRSIAITHNSNSPIEDHSKKSNKQTITTNKSSIPFISTNNASTSHSRTISVLNNRKKEYRKNSSMPWTNSIYFKTSSKPNRHKYKPSTGINQDLTQYRETSREEPSFQLSKILKEKARASPSSMDNKSKYQDLLPTPTPLLQISTKDTKS